MARKEINVFGTSFLDLLSGALAAVIILFVIVPKMSASDQEALRELEEANVQVTELAEMIRQLEDSIPREQLEAILQQIEELQQTIDRLAEQVGNLQQQLDQSRQENEQLRQQIAEQQQQLEEQRQRMSQLEEQAQQQQGGRGGHIFGHNAELGVVCQWPENIDVDLYVIELSTNEACFWNHKNATFGNLNEDITSRSDADDDRYELFYQTKVKPGRYLVSVTIYTGETMMNASSAHVEGYAVLFPGSGREKKIPFRTLTLTTPGNPVEIGTLTVTENNISLQ